MQFHAKIRHRSHIWFLWKGHHRLGGIVDGVQFQWDDATKSYVSTTPVPPEFVRAFMRNPAITVSMTAEPVTPPDETGAEDVEPVIVPPPLPEPPPLPPEDPNAAFRYVTKRTYTRRTTGGSTTP